MRRPSGSHRARQHDLPVWRDPPLDREPVRAVDPHPSRKAVLGWPGRQRDRPNRLLERPLPRDPGPLPGQRVAHPGGGTVAIECGRGAVAGDALEPRGRVEAPSWRQAGQLVDALVRGLRVDARPAADTEAAPHGQRHVAHQARLRVDHVELVPRLSIAHVATRAVGGVGGRTVQEHDHRIAGERQALREPRQLGGKPKRLAHVEPGHPQLGDAATGEPVGTDGPQPDAPNLA